MKNKRFIICAIFQLYLGLPSIDAQTALLSTGNNASGSGGSANYSIGQFAYQTKTGINGSVTESIQQPYEINIVSSLKDMENISLSWSIYPNPVSEFLSLNINDSNLLNNTTLTFQLFDVGGKLIQQNRISENTTIINMKKLKPCIYFLKINVDKTKNITYKIIKN